MNIGYIGLLYFGAWILTGIFLVPVTIALEILICQLATPKWLRMIPAVIGVAMAVPAAMLWEARSIAGISGEWWTLGGALILSLICSTIGWFVHRKTQ